MSREKNPNSQLRGLKANSGSLITAVLMRALKGG